MNDKIKKSGGVSKILFSYYSSEDNGVISRSQKAKGSLVDYDTYNFNISDKVESQDYNHLAGTDISSVFYPFVTKTRGQQNVYMPCMESGVTNIPSYTIPSGTIRISHISPSGGPINFSNLFPYLWNKSASGTLDDVSVVGASGEASLETIRNDGYIVNSDRFRDISNIRSVGLRAPIVAVGWGYSAKHADPYPSGSNRSLFRGDVQAGIQVNPDDYITAPVDLRYDEDRHVWSAPKGFFAEITGKITNSGIVTYSWKEKYQLPTASGIVFRDHPSNRSGSYFDNPAFEINNQSVSSGTIVWIPPKDRTDSNIFCASNKKDEFLAVILNHSAMPGYSGVRFDYTWREVFLNEDGNIDSSGTRLGYNAKNLVECSHQPETSGTTPWILAGIDAHGTTYMSANISLKPIGGGGTTDSHKSDVIVEMTERLTPSGTLLYTFSRMNSHDGNCS